MNKLIFNRGCIISFLLVIIKWEKNMVYFFPSSLRYNKTGNYLIIIYVLLVINF